MLKKSLIAAAALSLLALGTVSPALAYSGKHYKNNHNFWWHLGSPWFKHYAYRQLPL
jgi:hypothetical protein